MRAQRQIARDQRQPARRGPYGDRARRQPGSGQFLDEQLFQIGARTGLHPRGDFFAAQFEQEIGGHAASRLGVFKVVSAPFDRLRANGV
ncbi:UNVERIFIED_ORG: hypothetical protein M2348_001938 [Sphingomonas sp. R1F5B]